MALFHPQPFESAEDALENCNDISEGVLSKMLKLFLEVNLPSAKKLKDSTITLGVVRLFVSPRSRTRLMPDSVRRFRMSYTFPA